MDDTKSAFKAGGDILSVYCFGKTHRPRKSHFRACFVRMHLTLEFISNRMVKTSTMDG